jgi:hypothetical protein
MMKVFTDKTAAGALRDKLERKARAGEIYTVETLPPTLNRPHTPRWAVVARICDDIGYIGGRWRYA